MKLCLALALVGATAVVAQLETVAEPSEGGKPGFKVRLTDKFLKELIRARKEFVENQLGDFKENFSKKMKHMMKMMKHFAGDKAKDYKLKSAELINFEDGGGWTVAFKEPNVVEMTWNDMSMEAKFNVKKGEKEGSLHVKGGVKKAVMGLAISKTDKGHFKFAKTSCELELSDIEAKASGYGDEKDAEINKKLTEKIATGKTMIEQMACPWLEMGLVFVNTKMDEGDCKHEVPLFKGLYMRRCLEESPKATADYMDFAFCGRTVYGEDSSHTGDEGYEPAELKMSDDGKSKMMYFWQAEAMANEFMKVAFKHEKLKIEVSKDSFPKAAEKIHKSINYFMKLMEKPELPEGAEVTSWFKAVDKAPVFTVADGKMGMEATVEVKHKIDNCDACEWKEKTVKFTIGWEFVPELGEVKEGKVFPRMGGKLTVTKLEFKDVPAEMLEKVGDKPKEDLQNLLNKMHEKWADFRESHEEEFIPFKFFQIKGAQLLGLDKTVELNGDVIFNVKQLSDFANKMSHKHGHSSSSEDDDN